MEILVLSQYEKNTLKVSMNSVSNFYHCPLMQIFFLLQFLFKLESHVLLSIVLRLTGNFQDFF